MTVDIGRVLSTSFAIIKERIWQLIGLWAVFFALSLVFSTVFGGLLGASMFGAGLGAAAGFDDPAGLLGAGLAAFLSLLVFYVLYLAIGFAQQAALAIMTSPIVRPQFGDALVTGLKSGLTFVVLTILLFFAYFVIGLLSVLVLGALAMISEALVFVLGLAFLPVMIYLVCRLAMLLPVVAVEGVFNPFKAINRAWGLSKGHVLGIFVVMVIIVLAAIGLFALPVIILLGSGVNALTDPSSIDAAAGAIGSVIFAILLFIPLTILLQIISTALISAVHAQISDDHIEKVSEMFE